MTNNDFTSEVPPANETKLRREGTSLVVEMVFGSEIDAREYLGTMLMYLEQGTVSLVFNDGSNKKDDNEIPAIPPWTPSAPPVKPDA